MDTAYLHRVTVVHLKRAIISLVMRNNKSATCRGQAIHAFCPFWDRAHLGKVDRNVKPYENQSVVVKIGYFSGEDLCRFLYQLLLLNLSSHDTPGNNSFFMVCPLPYSLGARGSSDSCFEKSSGRDNGFPRSVVSELSDFNVDTLYTGNRGIRQQYRGCELL